MMEMKWNEAKPKRILGAMVHIPRSSAREYLLGWEWNEKCGENGRGLWESYKRLGIAVKRERGMGRDNKAIGWKMVSEYYILFDQKLL